MLGRRLLGGDHCCGVVESARRSVDEEGEHVFEEMASVTLVIFCVQMCGLLLLEVQEWADGLLIAEPSP